MKKLERIIALALPALLKARLLLELLVLTQAGRLLVHKGILQTRPQAVRSAIKLT